MTFPRVYDYLAEYADMLDELDGITPGDILTYKKNHRTDAWYNILTDTICHWLNNNLNPSWEKLTRALLHCEHNAIAAKKI